MSAMSVTLEKVERLQCLERSGGRGCVDLRGTARGVSWLTLTPPVEVAYDLESLRSGCAASSVTLAAVEIPIHLVESDIHDDDDDDDQTGGGTVYGPVLCTGTFCSM